MRTRPRPKPPKPVAGSVSTTPMMRSFIWRGMTEKPGARPDSEPAFVEAAELAEGLEFELAEDSAGSV